jgi:hypothetical protein
VEFFRKPLFFFLSLALIILLLWLANAVWMAAIFKTVEKAGPAGDLFGAINSLFTGLAFAGLIGTMIFQQRELKLQRKELRLQREEVAHTRTEIAGQRKQMELQNKHMQKQMFEQTFFQMLRVFNEYIQYISGPFNTRGNIPRKGRDQLGHIASSVTYADINGEIGSLNYENIYKDYSDDLGGYFRVLYNIIKYVDTSDQKDKKLYTNIVRAQLSDSELKLLKANLSTNVGMKFVSYVNEYELLKHCPDVWKSKK